MKRISLAALTGALAISTLAVAIDVASAAPRGGVYRGGVNRVGVGRVGVNRVGVNRVGVNRVGVGRVGIGYGRAGIGYRPGLGLAAGAALGTAAAYYGGSDYYGNGGYGAYASAAYDTSGGDTYILHGNYMNDRMPSHIAPSASARTTSRAGHFSRTAASECPARNRPVTLKTVQHSARHWTT